MAGERASEYTEFKYKIILLGSVGVGKTSIFNRIKQGKFTPDATEKSQQTHGADIYTCTRTVGNDRIQVTLWDTGGTERFRTLTNNYYHEANGALLVYCVQDMYTFENLRQYTEEASTYVDMNNFVWAIVANKVDLEYQEVEKERVEAQCKRLQTTLSFSVSAKTGKNVAKAFDDLITTIHTSQQYRPRRPTICIEDTYSKSDKKFDCC